MQFLEEEISQITGTVWESVLGIRLVRRSDVPAAPGRLVSGCVQFTGGWEGACMIECSADFARRAAGTMFGIEPSAASVADTQDAIGELANMTGGNVKALLPEPCRLSLPTVVEGADYTTRCPGGELVTTVVFDCDGGALVVRLLRKSQPSKGQEAAMPEVPLPHRREFSRVEVHLRAELSVAGLRAAEGTLEALSLKGGFLRCRTAPPLGVQCDLHLHLEGTDIEVRTRGHVVRQATDGVAIQFDEIVGVESLEHLRNLIRFNARDPAQVEQEFHDHLGLKRDA